MSLTTLSENVARFLAIFGIFVVLTMVAVGVYQAVLLDDVYSEISPSQLDENGDPNPAAIDDPQVRSDYQDAQTIAGWVQPAAFLGLGSLLTAIILTFAIVIYRGVKTMGTAFPAFWKAYLAAKTGEQIEVPDRVDDDISLPFGGGT